MRMMPHAVPCTSESTRMAESSAETSAEHSRQLGVSEKKGKEVNPL